MSSPSYGGPTGVGGLLRPKLISTLFPRLPQDSHRSYRLALGLGSAAMLLAPAALRLFPVAPIAAALLLPLLVALYLVDVNTYGDEPVWALSLTMGWGAVVGVGFGLLALAVAPSAASVIVNGTSQYLLVQGLVLPFCGFVLLLGPLILLRYQHFNAVLDGVTFGASTGCIVQRRPGDHIQRPPDRRRPAPWWSGPAVGLALAVARPGHADRRHGCGRGGLRGALVALSGSGARRPGAWSDGSSGRGAAAGRTSRGGCRRR